MDALSGPSARLAQASVIHLLLNGVKRRSVVEQSTPASNRKRTVNDYLVQFHGNYNMDCTFLVHNVLYR
jgi:hypothetical protein